MSHAISYRPSFALLTVSFGEGGSPRSEADAMVSYFDGIDIETNAKGGLFESLEQSVLDGESFFQNTFNARQVGEVSSAPSLPDGIVYHGLEDETLCAQSGSYIASDPALDLDIPFGRAKTFFGGEGLFLLKLTDAGDSFLSSYGTIHEVELGEGGRYTIDTSHIVASDEATNFSVKRVGGLKPALFSGGNLVCTFTSPETIWIRSHNTDSFLSWLTSKLSTNNSA